MTVVERIRGRWEPVVRSSEDKKVTSVNRGAAGCRYRVCNLEYRLFAQQTAGGEPAEKVRREGAIARTEGNSSPGKI